MVVLALYQRKWFKPTALHQHLISRYVFDILTFIMRHQGKIKYTWKKITTIATTYFPSCNPQILRCGPPLMNKAMAAHLEALGYAPEMLFQFWSLKTCWPSIWIGIHHSPGFNKKTRLRKNFIELYALLLTLQLVLDLRFLRLDVEQIIPRFEIF